MELLRELAVASCQEPANLSYELFAGTEDDHHIVILETYIDVDGFAAHRTSEHFERIGRGRILALLTHRKIEEYSVERQGSAGGRGALAANLGARRHIWRAACNAFPRKEAAS